MSVAISIMFSGLIAFVPGGSSITAYLVRAPNHEQVLQVYGNVALNPVGGACSLSGMKVVCKLARTDIVIDKFVEGNLKFASKKSDRILPANLDDRSSPDWLVHLASVEPEQSIGKIKEWRLISGDVGARLKFTSDSVKVGELDGEEAGKPALIGFRGGGRTSRIRQAVAESIIFSARIIPPMIKITVSDRVSGKFQVITARCEAANCIGLNISNTFNETLCEDGDHSKHYYSLLERQGSRMLPFSIDRRKCVKGDNRHVDFRLLLDGLEIIRPLSPAEVKFVISELKNPEVRSKIKTQENLLKFLRGKQISNKLLAEIVDVLKIQDRVICPPVLLESALALDAAPRTPGPPRLRSGASGD